MRILGSQWNAPPPSYDQSMGYNSQQTTYITDPLCSTPSTTYVTRAPLVQNIYTPLTVPVPAATHCLLCPSCRIGYMETEWPTILGILAGIFLFPFGLICCAVMKNYRCTNCGLSMSQL